jgi:hypothetical protein
MTYGKQSRHVDHVTRSRPPMSQWQAERARGPILPMLPERKSFLDRVLGR